MDEPVDLNPYYGTTGNSGYYIFEKDGYVVIDNISAAYKGFNIYGHTTGFYFSIAAEDNTKEIYVKKGMSFRIYSDRLFDKNSELRARFFGFIN